MKDWKIDRETRLYVSASSQPSQFGVSIYNELFRRLGVNAVYLARRATDARALIEGIRGLGVAGASVSMPLKSAVVDLLDTVAPDAAEVRSVNTIVLRDGRLEGHNTDLDGLRGVLRPLGRSAVLVWGSGSVTDSALKVLAELGLPAFVGGRNRAAVAAKAQRWGRSTWSGEPFDLFLNATPLSLTPLEPEIRALLGSARPRIFDLVVPAKGNHLLAYAKEEGLDYLPGFAMYQHQFVRQFGLYTGLTVEPEAVREVATAFGLI